MPKILHLISIATKKATDKYGDYIEKTARCNLSGRLIDLTNRDAWNLDHIISEDYEGCNNLDNMQLLCSHANKAKSSYTAEETIALAKDIVEYNSWK